MNLAHAIRTRYAWPGGYPLFAFTSDGAALCLGCCRGQYRIIREAQRSADRHSGWNVSGVDVNWENAGLYCDHCSERIESAYAEDAHEEI